MHSNKAKVRVSLFIRKKTSSIYQFREAMNTRLLWSRRIEVENQTGPVTQVLSTKNNNVEENYVDDKRPIIIGPSTTEILSKHFEVCCRDSSKTCRPDEFVRRISSAPALKFCLRTDNRDRENPELLQIKLSKLLQTSLCVYDKSYSPRINWSQVLNALSINCQLIETVPKKKRTIPMNTGSWVTSVHESTKHLANGRSFAESKLAEMFRKMNVPHLGAKRIKHSTPSSSFSRSDETSAVSSMPPSSQDLGELLRTTKRMREEQEVLELQHKLDEEAAATELKHAQEKLSDLVDVVEAKFKEALLAIATTDDDEEPKEADFELSTSVLEEAEVAIKKAEDFGSSHLMIAEEASISTSELRNKYEDLCDEVETSKAIAEAMAEEEAKNAAQPSSPAVNQLLQRFTSEEMQLTEAAWSHGPKSETVVVSLPAGAGRSMVDILGKHMDRMRDAWLFDETINGYMFLLQERDRALCDADPTRLPTHFYSSFFFEKMFEGGAFSYSNVKRWGKKVAGGNIFKMGKVVIPVNINNSHWCLCCANFEKKTIEYFDSMSAKGFQYLKGMKCYLAEEAKKFKGTVPDDLLDMETWTLLPCRHRDNDGNIITPQQDNCNDCGVFSCTFANLVSVNQPFSFTARDMPTIRRRITMDLLNKRITDP